MTPKAIAIKLLKQTRPGTITIHGITFEVWLTSIQEYKLPDGKGGFNITVRTAGAPVIEE